MHAPDKPNPTTGQDGRAGKNKSFGRLNKENQKYAEEPDFASEETALAYALREALRRKAVRA